MGALKRLCKAGAAQRAERKRIVKYLRELGLDEAADLVEASKEGAICLREGHIIRGVDDVLRCDSGEYEDLGDGLVCINCRLGAA